MFELFSVKSHMRIIICLAFMVIMTERLLLEAGELYCAVYKLRLSCVHAK